MKGEGMDQTTAQRNQYENALKIIANHGCESMYDECTKTDSPVEGYCCPCLATAVLKSQNA